jgi:hypothetical protein
LYRGPPTAANERPSGLAANPAGRFIAANRRGGYHVSMARPDAIEEIINTTEPLQHPRRNRLPLLLWSAALSGAEDVSGIREIARELDRRGIALLSAWNHADPEGVQKALRVARVQHELGHPVVVNTNALLHRFCDGSEGTGHLDSDGRECFDTSYDVNVHLGCPFRLEHRIPEIRGRVERFADAFRDEGLSPALVFADWEIDGPIEWNDSWDIAKRCRICRDRIPAIDDFSIFQRSYREIRAELQRLAYSEPLTRRFSDALVANYGVYPHDGRRYWYDYFERPPRAATYRPWFHEFPLTGYTAAMPVVYAWDYLWSWDDSEIGDFRWFRHMLAVASNAGAHTPSHVPIIPFVHRNIIRVSSPPIERAVEMSKDRFRELLWHVLLRGGATLFSWYPSSLAGDEIGPVHEVYAASLEFADHLAHGTPMLFHVPAEPGPIISAVAFGSKLLVRRTDFTDAAEPVEVEIGGERIRVPRTDGRCVVVG